jgi:hypothetical protein
MSQPLWSGQNAGQRSLQRLQQQQSEQMPRLQDMQKKAWYQAEQRRRPQQTLFLHPSGDPHIDSSAPLRTLVPGGYGEDLGLVGRAVRGLLTLVFAVVAMGAGILAVAAVTDDQISGAVVPVWLASWVSWLPGASRPSRLRVMSHPRERLPAQ